MIKSYGIKLVLPILIITFDLEFDEWISVLIISEYAWLICFLSF